MDFIDKALDRIPPLLGFWWILTFMRVIAYYVFDRNTLAADQDWYLFMLALVTVVIIYTYRNNYDKGADAGAKMVEE